MIVKHLIKLSEQIRTDKNQIKVISVGGIETVVKAISAHIDITNLCIVGCGALSNMIKYSRKNVDNRKNN